MTLYSRKRGLVSSFDSVNRACITLIDTSFFSEIREYCLREWPAYKPHQPLQGQLHSPVRRTHCHTSSDENRHSRLHPSIAPRGQNAYICMVARHINNDRADGCQVRHLYNRSTTDNRTIDGFFTPVSSLRWTSSNGMTTSISL